MIRIPEETWRHKERALIVVVDRLGAAKHFRIPKDNSILDYLSVAEKGNVAGLCHSRKDVSRLMIALQFALGQKKEQETVFRGAGGRDLAARVLPLRGDEAMIFFLAV